ncbi:class I SAM-dependent methyltransferase [Pseudonocardia sichuanensis]
MSDGRVLFQEFLRAPTRVATVTASSDALVAALLAPHRFGGAPVVVELGAGTGRVTGALQRRLGPAARHVAIEINPVLAGRLADRHPGVTVVAADAARLPAVLAEHGVERVDALVSLLPWSAYAAAPVPELAASVLAPSGTFTQVTLRGLHLLPPARRQRRDLRTAFGEVTGSATVWRNLPPARILVARSPRHSR